jgi:sn1-specific diacylglycerol lipase
VAKIDVQNEFYVYQGSGSNEVKYLCEEVGLMKTYIILEIVIILLTLITLLVIFILSFRGSVVNTKKRRHIVPLWLIVAILTIFDAVCAVLGSIWTFGYGLKENCYSLGSHQYVVRLLIGVVVCQWVMLLVVILVLFCIYTRVGKLYKETPIMRRRPSRRASAFRRGHLKHSRIWMNRCKVLSCHCNCGSAPSEGRSTAFTEVSQLLARYFEEYDLVPSDIAVGLILLRRQYQTEKRALKQSISSVSSIGKSALSCTYSCDELPILASFDEKEDKKTILAIQYYCRYMMAAYGWSKFRSMNSCSWPCKAAANVNFNCSGQRNRYEWNIGDTFCQCHLAAVTELIGDDDDAEVVYSIWRDEVFETPFYVAADHTKRAIVIAIRGSKSFNDALTDLCVDAVPVDVHGLSDCWAHKGMYHAAMYVKATLEADKVLDTWLDRYPGYRVLTVGHSLGAGVAALLALLLRPGYPNIFCYSYSPPGALMSLELATYSAEFVVTCFVGLDVVPRVSYATVEDLKVKVVRMVAASRAPKWSLIAHSFPFGCCGIYYCCGCSCCCPGDEVIDNEFLVSQEVENNITKLKTPFYQLRHIENERQRKRMYLPGKVLHLQHDVKHE